MTATAPATALLAAPAARSRHRSRERHLTHCLAGVLGAAGLPAPTFDIRRKTRSPPASQSAYRQRAWAVHSRSLHRVADSGTISWEEAEIAAISSAADLHARHREPLSALSMNARAAQMAQALRDTQGAFGRASRTTTSSRFLARRSCASCPSP